jgi:hypothetical protein
MSMFFPSHENNNFHRFFKEALHSFRDPESRARFILDYIADISQQVFHSYTSGFIDGQVKADALHWEARLLRESLNPWSRVWL